MNYLNGKVMTSCGSIEPEQMGKVMMHEHLHLDFAQKDEIPFDKSKLKILEKEAVPTLLKLKDKYSCSTIVDMSFPPHRAEPWVHKTIAEMTGFNFILATGFYREIEMDTYWIHHPDDQIWPFVRDTPLEGLEAFCLSEIENGIHGSGICPGVLKAASSNKETTTVEEKAIRAVARVQKKTGLLINTHSTTSGTFKSQFDIIVSEGVDPRRICLGHTQEQVADEWEHVKECMKMGAVFSLDVRVNHKTSDAIKRAFDEGFGNHLVLAMDSGFKVGYNEYNANPDWRPRQGDSANLAWWGPGPEPFTYMFTDVIPAYKDFGVTEEMLQAMLVDNPQRILPVT